MKYFGRCDQFASFAVDGLQGKGLMPTFWLSGRDTIKKIVHEI